MKDGTFRNFISKLRKSGVVELAFRSRPAFYTLTGKKFNKTMTLDHVGVPNAIIDQSVLKAMPIYNWIIRQPMEKQSLHNIRLRFESAGLWDIYSKMNTTFVVNPYNKDIILPTSVYFDYLEVVVTIHHTNTNEGQMQIPLERLSEDFIKKVSWSVWEMGVSYTKGHPGPFPYELPSRLIQLYTVEGETVLDPFGGSGTTMKVARILKRNSFLYEINSEYIDLIKENVGWNSSLDSDTRYEIKIRKSITR